MSARFDVIVVGARVAGASTAMLLARGGARVLCVDRSRYGSDTVSTHALMRAGVVLLQRWGLLDAVQAAGTPPVRRTVFHYGEESSVVSIKPAAGVDALYAPRRTVLDRLLVDAARDAGVEFRFGVPVTDLLRSHNGAVQGIVLSDRRGRERPERADLVIGADGVRSTVAEIVRPAVHHQGSHAGSLLYGYWADFPSDGYEWFYRPSLTAGTIPTNDGLTCVFVGAPPSSLASVVRSGSPASAFANLAAAVGLGDRLASAGEGSGIRHVHRLAPAYLRTAAGPGWALVGDSGHWLDPLSTHGMTAALRDAELLARAVLSSTPSADRHRSLEHYQSVRDRLSLPMIEATDRIASYAWDLGRIRGLLRQLASAMTAEVEAVTALRPAA